MASRCLPPIRNPWRSRIKAADEFDRQVHNLIDRGYPELTGRSQVAFTNLVEPLRNRVLARQDRLAAPTRARVPFLVVISRRAAPPDQTMTLTALDGRSGFVSKDTLDINEFEPIDAVQVPEGDAYLVFDVDRGSDTRNVSPDDALDILTAQGRTPLTIDEGIAFITHFPDSLEKNNCFQTAGSRRADRRVPGLWISERRPKLGFCWAGNVHTWLGAASCLERVGAAAEP